MATYKHKTINRFSVTDGINAPFQFDNHMLVITDDEENERFLRLLNGAPIQTQNQIVEINEDALRHLEQRPGAPRVIRGAQDTGRIPAAGKGAESPKLLNEEIMGRQSALIDGVREDGTPLTDEDREKMLAADQDAVNRMAAEALAKKAAEDEAEANKAKAAPGGGMASLLAKASGQTKPSGV